MTIEEIKESLLGLPDATKRFLVESLGLLLLIGGLAVVDVGFAVAAIGGTLFFSRLLFRKT